jgi:hypothetical protein
MFKPNVNENDADFEQLDNAQKRNADEQPNRTTYLFVKREKKLFKITIETAFG